MRPSSTTTKVPDQSVGSANADSGARHALRRFSTDPKENNTESRSCAKSEGQLPEVLVERNHDPTFELSAGQNLWIWSAGRFLVYPDDVVPVLSKWGNRRPRHVLVGEEPSAHWLPRGERIDLFGLHDSACVLQARMNVFGRQLGVAAENVRFGPTLREKVDDKFN
jgi:hypothetical protein